MFAALGRTMGIAGIATSCAIGCNNENSQQNDALMIQAETDLARHAGLCSMSDDKQVDGLKFVDCFMFEAKTIAKVLQAAGISKAAALAKELQNTHFKRHKLVVNDPQTVFLLRLTNEDAKEAFRHCIQPLQPDGRMAAIDSCERLSFIRIAQFDKLLSPALEPSATSK